MVWFESSTLGRSEHYANQPPGDLEMTARVLAI